MIRSPDTLGRHVCDFAEHKKVDLNNYHEQQCEKVTSKQTGERCLGLKEPPFFIPLSVFLPKLVRN